MGVLGPLNGEGPLGGVGKRVLVWESGSGEGLMVLDFLVVLVVVKGCMIPSGWIDMVFGAKFSLLGSRR
jgi:hypothetical protein